MDGNLSLILAFLVSISVVLALVIKFKLHPFLSLFIGCLLMGVCSGLDPMAIIKTSCKGFGDTMGDIGIIILPDGKPVYISVFVTDAHGSILDAEKTIADLSQAAWDYYISEKKGNPIDRAERGVRELLRLETRP